MIGRKKPYTERGISRVPCVMCRKRPARHQWRICSTGMWTPVCIRCDIEINRIVAVRAFGKRRGEAIVAAYAERAS